MQAIAQNLSERDMQMLATDFSKQHPPLLKTQTPPAPDLVAAGRHMAETEDDANVPVCFSCHAADGHGNGAHFPGIAGEPATFTIARLHEFQTRARQPPPKPGSMTAVAAALDETQFRRVAAFLSVSPPRFEATPAV
ncbi:c-type cytochrome [Burkholderia pyrrocinia]|uniref:c-type cytochrome n=1 Tax=Burkholderia pyrrocinia TaxID=60550 RepID=UPI0011E4D95A|nr:c-type cytochrome [Burkholderia pyrrocinia]